MNSTKTRRSTRVKVHTCKTKSKTDHALQRPPKLRLQPSIVISSDSEDEVGTTINVTPLITPIKGDEKKIDLISPSILLEKLKIQHSPSIVSKRKLFDNGKENALKGSPPKQKKTQFYKHDNENTTDDVYSGAKKALHSTYPTNMPGREEELKELHHFIIGHLNDNTAGTLYISGPPGTGKTAALNVILQEKKICSGLKHAYINCTSIKSSASVFSKISKSLNIKSIGRSEKDHCAAIEDYIDKKNAPILLVLDEIDQLVTKNQSVLYTIFEWPSRPKSRLILIGIANALDLTDRILPRLQARCELKPKLMHFTPYTKQQIVEIFKNRLKEADVPEIFTPVALQMLAGKISAISGDLRRALDIGRRVIDLIDKNKGGDVLKSVGNMIDTKCVDVKQVMTVLGDVYSTDTDHMDESFPLQQKIILCSLILIRKNCRNKDVTIGKLHEVYRKICKSRNLQAVDQSEFVGVCSLVESKGIIKIVKKKETRMNKVALEWDEEEIASVMRDKQLLASILQDDLLKGKI